MINVASAYNQISPWGATVYKRVKLNQNCYSHFR